MVAAHKPKNPNKLDDSGVFLSKGSINNFPQDVSRTLFFTATSFDLGDRDPAPEEGKREGMRKIHEIGGRNCRELKYPEIPNLTRKSQTYSISFRPKQSTDWEVNQFVVQTKRAGTGAGVPAPSFALSSTYQDLARHRSASELQHAKPSWTRPKDVAKGHQPSLISKSMSQDTFAGEHSGFKAIGDRFLPIHELSVELGSRDFWYSTYDSEHRNFYAKPHKGHSHHWRKHRGVKLVDQFFKELHSAQPPTQKPLKPLSMLGTNSDLMERLRDKPATR